MKAKHGQGAGERYLLREPWGSIAEKMFMKGEKKKAEKSSPGEIHEKILKEAVKVDRYDTPSLIEVSKAVSGMVSNTRNGKAARGAGAGGRGRKSLEATYPELAKLRAEFAACGGNILPAAGLRWLTDQPEGLNAGLEPEAVKRLVSKWRKDARQEVLNDDNA